MYIVCIWLVAVATQPCLLSASNVFETVLYIVNVVWDHIVHSLHMACGSSHAALSAQREQRFVETILCIVNVVWDHIVHSLHMACGSSPVATQPCLLSASNVFVETILYIVNVMWDHIVHSLHMACGSSHAALSAQCEQCFC